MSQDQETLHQLVEEHIKHKFATHDTEATLATNQDQGFELKCSWVRSTSRRASVRPECCDWACGHSRGSSALRLCVFAPLR